MAASDRGELGVVVPEQLDLTTLAHAANELEGEELREGLTLVVADPSAGEQRVG
jgi:hypothetical protein